MKKISRPVLWTFSLGVFCLAILVVVDYFWPLSEHIVKALIVRSDKCVIGSAHVRWLCKDSCPFNFCRDFHDPDICDMKEKRFRKMYPGVKVSITPSRTVFEKTVHQKEALALLAASVQFAGNPFEEVQYQPFGRAEIESTRLSFFHGEKPDLVIEFYEGDGTDSAYIYGKALGKRFELRQRFEVRCTKELSKAVQELFKEGPDTIAQVVPEKTER